MKAAEAAAAELPHLQGEELRQQARRVQELIATAKRQQRETEATASREQHDPPPGYDAAGKSKQGVEASSTGRGRAKDKQPRAHRERSASSHPRDHGRDPAGRREDGNRNELQAGRSVKERVGHKITIDQRLGPLGPETGNDARNRIDALKVSSIIEEEDVAAHRCFGPRIRTEQFPRGFTLPRDTLKYNGTAKPEDWLPTTSRPSTSQAVTSE